MKSFVDRRSFSSIVILSSPYRDEYTDERAFQSMVQPEDVLYVGHDNRHPRFRTVLPPIHRYHLFDVLPAPRNNEILDVLRYQSPRLVCSSKLWTYDWRGLQRRRK